MPGRRKEIGEIAVTTSRATGACATNFHEFCDSNGECGCDCHFRALGAVDWQVLAFLLMMTGPALALFIWACIELMKR